MCGRYRSGIDDEMLEFVLEREEEGAVERYLNIGEVFPGMEVPVFYAGSIGLRAKNARWGYKADTENGFSKSKSLIINARAETANEKPLYRTSERIFIPASGYYEWDSDKKRYLISGDKTILLCGLRRECESGWEYTILTTKAMGKHGEIHHRMPLMINHDEIEPWLYSPSFADRKMRALQSEYNSLDIMLEA